MTETEDEVTPLFRPGLAVITNAKFICNIGDELSLWVLGTSLRIYGADSDGIWLESEGAIKRMIDKINQYTNRATISAIARNYDAVVVYMRMLLGAQP